MFNLQISFDRPWYLLLLLLLPLMWAWSFRGLSGLGRWRRLTALSLRSLVVLLFVFALAEIQWVRISDKLTVIYLLDQSESIPAPKRKAMMQYVIEDVKKHRNQAKEDKAGVIVFGSDAKIEVPPYDDEIYSTGEIETYMELDTDATNLASALKLAQASFPHDTSKRIVVVTDGNENLGDARTVARSLARDGVGIDVVPVRLTVRADVEVEKVTLPPDIQEGQPFETRVVLNNYSRPTADNPEGTVTGTLKVTRNLQKDEELLFEEKLTLQPGKNVYTFPDTLDSVGAYTYQADFTPDNKQRDDLVARNNRATAFLHVRGKGSVLLIEDWEHPGEFATLVERLRKNEFEVLVIGSDELFTSLSELQAFDTVILANVPRSSGDDAKTITHFSDDQIRMLVSNTQQLGAGLIMLGGQNSFGVGGWTNTELEKAMPVDFQIKNKKIRAVGALAMVMHASEMPQGNHWQKVIGREALKTLGPMDYCGVVFWGNNGKDSWLWGSPPGLMRVGGKKKTMVARLGRMTPGDMPFFDPGMQLALQGFRRVNASVKHMIIISDGDPSPPKAGTLAGFKRAGIKVSTVAVGSHGQLGSATMQKIASTTGGKYYVVRNAKALPKIYQREARRVAMPLISKPDGGVAVGVNSPAHDILQGIDPDSLPRINAFVMTTKKENPLVEQLLIGDKPADEANSTVLAAWTYGLGRTVAFTTDTGQRWAEDWPEWENYDKFFTQMVRWSMGAGAQEETTDAGKFTVATDYKDGRVRVVVTALNKDDEFLNFLTMSGSAVGPDLKPFEVKIQQVAPGRYIGEFEANKSGSYLLNVKPSKGSERIKAGVSVPYSDEFRVRETNFQLLTDLAGMEPTRGQAGKVLEGSIAEAEIAKLLEFNTFRRGLAKAVSSRDVWPLVLVITAMFFLADVFVRRVTIGFEWLTVPFLWLRNNMALRNEQQQPDQRLARLRNQKEAIGDQIDERRAATRFEPQADADIDTSEVLQQSSRDEQAPAPRPPSSSLAPGQAEEESYTSRLLKAKQKAWKDKDRDK